MILDYYTVTVNGNEYEAFMKRPGQICIRTKDPQKVVCQAFCFSIQPAGSIRNLHHPLLQRPCNRLIKADLFQTRKPV